MKVEWDFLTPNEIWEAAKTMPKISGPWEQWDEELWFRPSAGEFAAATIRRGPFYWIAEVDDYARDGIDTFPTLEEAKHAVDEQLINDGWLLAWGKTVE